MSARQRQVYELKRDGYSNAFIARFLGIAVGTVVRHARRAYDKLGIDDAARRDAQLDGRRNALRLYL